MASYETPVNLQQIRNKTAGLVKTLVILVGVLILGLVLFNLFTFRVHETEQAVVTRLGKVVRIVVPQLTPEIQDAISQDARLRGTTVVVGHGLFYKTPFIESAELFRSTMLTYDTQTREVNAKDKKKLILGNFVQWRITNPALFKMTMKNERNAHTRIDDIVYSQINQEVGRTEAHTLIADQAYVNAMLQRIVEYTNGELVKYGMQLVDVRIKRTEWPAENSKNIFDRMRTERERQAKQYRSEGQEEAQKIRSDADKQATIIEAQAYAQAEQTKGEGDAEATRIYNEAYNRDPDFYEFYRTLQAYKETLGSNTKIVIDAKSPFAKYLFSPQ
jgi:membrane protease subunit HflC